MNLMWAPGMSDAAREICRHLSGREKAALCALSFLLGICGFAIPVVIMGSVMAEDSIPGLPAVLAFPLVVCLVAVFWLSVTLQRRILLNTQVAKDKGFTKADIVARQPFSRRDHMIVGGTAALAMAITLAGVFLVFLNAAP